MSMTVVIQNEGDEGNTLNHSIPHNSELFYCVSLILITKWRYRRTYYGLAPGIYGFNIDFSCVLPPILTQSNWNPFLNVLHYESENVERFLYSDGL